MIVILNTPKNIELGYQYQWVKELPHEGLDHKVLENNGTFYLDSSIPQSLKDVLVRLYQTRERVILDYGDVKTNESWGEVNDVTGYIRRSSGPMHTPILVHSKASSGGGGVLEYCIIKIVSSKGKRVIWENKIDILKGL